MDPKLIEFIENKEHYLDGFISDGSDQELFVASYIHGHFSVVYATIEKTYEGQKLVGDELTMACEVFLLSLQESINKAIKNKELSDSDAQDVSTMLKRLMAHN